MKGYFKVGMVLVLLLIIKSTLAASNSEPFSFILAPGGHLSLPLDKLYPNPYNISCNVKDMKNSSDDTNAVRIYSAYRPHTLDLDGQAIGWHSEVTVKTKMNGSIVSINNVRRADDRIYIENRDFTDDLAFTCVAYLVEG